ncbi:MATE family efflux transporter [Archangium sp.]|uniref:MATE family efflux transporter n=1 Tax=Archangium sp. TaxID=1872627 RepID=UPI002D41D890|nr:MATE family efflux transporter [Archangium sp.]HYO53224.1 MATE family efflux transporter [Archangium sp.]
MEKTAVHPGDTREQPGLWLFRLTWPIFLEFLLFMLMGTADTLMLSGVSDDAVSAVGVVNQYIFICILIMGVIGNGASIVVAQYIGARRAREAARIVALSITLNFLLGIAVSSGLLLFGNAILSHMNLQGQVLAHARTYMGIAGGFLFQQALINIFSSMIRTYGFTKQSMYVSMGMNVVHVLGNYLLIFGHFGFPKMEVAGAAVSTVVSRAVALVVFVWMLYRVMEVRMAPRDYVTFSKEYIRKILKVGIPSAVEQITYQSCQMVFLYYVTFLGSAALASRQYAMAISQYVFLFSLAIGLGTSILVGHLVGASRTEDAYRQVLGSLKWSVTITVLMDVVAILFREPLVGLFTENGDIIRLTAQVIVLGLFLESGRACNLVLVNALRATGDSPFTAYMGFISMACMSLSLGYLFVFRLNLGLAGVWLAISADEWTRGVIFWFRWRSRAWEKQSLVTPMEQPASAAFGD